jgi:hypothetical protein
LFIASQTKTLHLGAAQLFQIQSAGELCPIIKWLAQIKVPSFGVDVFMITLLWSHFLDVLYPEFFFSKAQENCAPLYIKQKKGVAKKDQNKRPPYGGQ